VSAAIAFLNATLLLHPPTSKHIREDDIYAKVSFQRDVPMSAKATLRNKGKRLHDRRVCVLSLRQSLIRPPAPRFQQLVPIVFLNLFSFIKPLIAH